MDLKHFTEDAKAWREVGKSASWEVDGRGGWWVCEMK